MMSRGGMDWALFSRQCPQPAEPDMPSGITGEKNLQESATSNGRADCAD
jgi:hypothetical protein